MGRPDAGGSPGAGVRRVESADDARELATWLLLPGRRLPTVVLTIAGGQDQPFGDPEAVKDAVGDLAEVVLIASSAASWAFSREMPPDTQVYGGAGRVYPVDHKWVSAPGLSRLRFAYSAQDRPRVTEHLMNDALHAALRGGVLPVPTSPGLRRRSGSVGGLIDSRALVTLDDGTTATVWEELTLPGVPLDRVLARGQAVTGVYDPASRRLDVSGELRHLAPTDVTGMFAAGDVVLADVAAVGGDCVRLRLLPGLHVDVERSAVTSNPADALRELFSLGEVVTARVASTEPLRLRLDDVDDDETPGPAPSLLPGGPPWLRPADRERPATPAVPPPMALPEPVPDPVVPRRPSPLDLARRGPTPPPAPRPPATADSGERDRIVQLTNELAAERATRRAMSDELTGLRVRASGLEAELHQALRSVERLQTRYRSADLARQRAATALKAAGPAAVVSASAFPDAEGQFRHDIYQEWVRRVPATEKSDKPLAEYLLEPGFLPSVDRLEGVSRAKIVAVVVEVLTGQAQHLNGRRAHQLRTPPRDDGATCWRVALQQETPGARRLHYWRVRDRYELSRVVIHDDFRP